MSGPHWVCPRSRRVLSRSTLLRLQVALQGNCLQRALGCMHFPGLSHSGSGSRVLHKGADSVGPVFCALTGLSSSGPQVLGEFTLPGEVRLIASFIPAARFPGCTAGASSQVCHMSLLGSRSLFAILLADVNCPGSQEDLVSNWGPAHSLVEDAISEAEICPFPALAAARLPLVEDGPDHLWYSFSPVFCEQAGSALD